MWANIIPNFFNVGDAKKRTAQIRHSFKDQHFAQQMLAKCWLNVGYFAPTFTNTDPIIQASIFL